jgi:hypothetical protein
MDPRAGRWLSGDPAVGEYIPQARGSNKRLPNGGVYNTVSLHAYNYSNNNPVNYTDPDGRQPRLPARTWNGGMNQLFMLSPVNKTSTASNASASDDNALLSERITYTSMGLIPEGPCYMRALIGVAETFAGRNLELDELNTLHTTLTTGDNPAVKTNNNYYVERGPEVIAEALKILDPESNFSVKIAKPGDSDYAQVRENAAGSLLHVSNASNQHWQEGDRNGSFRWDGAHGLDNSKYQNINETRYVSIERLPD